MITCMWVYFQNISKYVIKEPWYVHILIERILVRIIYMYDESLNKLNFISNRSKSLVVY